ncbi:SART-1 family-domain-containing protein [Crepidotus variabilis]|uniref:SART-1 family-domain-containing protein n=1 Tax=Crepidotus variabilis TaxID=179855 RepID=A0A9P6JUM3_9AGAR|nr:SART-1 family-domain-containing protein [Crepidotus variabilis]
MSMEESISLEETNKIRISLGLKPLTDDKAPVLDADQVAADNYSKVREKEAKEKEAKKIQDKIAKVRNRRELNASLKGATLGDAEDDGDDTLKWIKRNKKKEKQLAKQRQQEIENRDQDVLGEYTERDLEGLKVSHDFDKMDEGEARILTLKDSRILDNEEDELQNVEMAEEEKTKKRLELKTKKRDYTGYDDDEFEEGNQGLMKRSVLAKYDEDIEGSQESSFRLGSSNLSGKVQRAEEQQQTAAARKKSLLSIDYSKTLITDDYRQEGEVGFKKPKTKKKRTNRRGPADSEAGPDEQQMDMDEPIFPRERNLDVNFVDDDELQAALTRSRKAKLHKTHKLTPEELAKKIAAERVKEEESEIAIQKEEAAAADTGGGGLTFDETSEFVQAVGNNPIGKPKREPKELSLTPAQPKSRDTSMAPGDVALEELEAGEVRVKDEEEDIDIDMEMLDDIAAALEHTESEEKRALDEGRFGVGTSSEQNFATGMAATLNILRHQGILAQPAADQLQRERVQKQRDLWLAQLRRQQNQRDLEKAQGRGSSKDQAQREYENRQREQQEARDTMDLFKDYKPDINIAYPDENGRLMSVKEAWKALSHKFHGKGSGKMKTEKRLKKIAEEKKKEAMASGDTPLSMNRAFQMRQEKTGQAHFVLSVGNRGAVPQAAEFFDAQPLAKGKTEKAKKKKEIKNPQQSNDSGFITLPAPSLHLTSNGTTPPIGSAAGSPAPRAGFSRINSTAVEMQSSSSSTPVPGERPKLAFGGLNLKRKAGEEAAGSPPPKRR